MGEATQGRGYYAATRDDLGYGDIVRVHPASDWFMRGVTSAEVVKVGRTYVHLQSSMFGVKFRLPFDLVEVAR